MKENFSSPDNLYSLSLDGNSLQLEHIARVATGKSHLSLCNQSRARVLKSRAVVERMLEEKRVVYGITTGFGKFKDVFIHPQESMALQRKFLLSHACGVGKNFDEKTVRAIILLRANALAKGFSGIRSEVIELLLELVNRNIHPLVPEKGSVGASGDLAPLAHLALVLTGLGRAVYKDKEMSGAEALSLAELEPVELQAKEGLALTNGTQVMTAVGCLVIDEALQLIKLADIIAAMSLEGLLGTNRAFADEIHNARPHPGQKAVASNLRALLANSALMESHRNCGMVQDAYSLRCIPQIHGASRQALAHAKEVIEIEINSATDNPLVFDDEVISGGNFHGQPIALVMDYVSTALSELANVSERRTERLVNPALSNGLPPFLALEGGLNSGFMIAQYTAAALVSENKSLAHPACVDSIPTSANQEDHVSMGTIAARKAREILANLKDVLAIELLCASQALDIRFGRLQEKCMSGNNPREMAKSGGHDTSGCLPGIGVEAARLAVRETIPPMLEDRLISTDIALASNLLSTDRILKAVEGKIGALQ